MDALLVFAVIVIGLAVLAALSAVYGVDSREGFANGRVGSGPDGRPARWSAGGRS